jgi:hypothetical protein
MYEKRWIEIKIKIAIHISISKTQEEMTDKLIYQEK